jgi:hypothetical protein
MRTLAMMIGAMLAGASAAGAADQKIDAKISGTIEGNQKVGGSVTINVAHPAPEKAGEEAESAKEAKISGALTLTLAPEKKPEDMDKAEKLKWCGDAWNKNLKKYDEARKNGQKPAWLWLTRLDYRTCLDKCLAGVVVTPLHCQADLPSAQQNPAGGGG